MRPSRRPLPHWWNRCHASSHLFAGDNGPDGSSGRTARLCQTAFDLLQHHRAVGPLRLDLPTVVTLPLYYLLFLGLFVALRKSDRANSLLATVLAFAGVTLVLATPTALSMVQLSDKFAAATSDTARNQLLAAGEAIMAADIWHSTAPSSAECFSNAALC